MEFKSFLKTVEGNEANHCGYTTRLDLYGCGCAHDCAYCYAKSLLSFRGLWNPSDPRVANIEKVERKIRRMEPDSMVRLGGMTDCFQPIEQERRNTLNAIRLLQKFGVGYLAVTKSDMILDYLDELDPKLAHVQVSITWLPWENAPETERRIHAVEVLQREGINVAVRLSPYIPGYVDFDRLNRIECDKIVVEFLRVNHWIEKWLPIDTSAYTVRHAGYRHLPLDEKVKHLKGIDFPQLTVCEDVTEHYEYWRDNVNFNPKDCCNLRR